MVNDKIYINGLSIIAPGIVEKDKSLAILCNEQQWCAEPLPKVVPTLLPKNERRRTTQVIKVALQTIQPLLHPDDDLDKTSTVFASSDGDLGIDNAICQALAKTEKVVSPTQFHNSVHNAPAGYWAIASKMHSASVSISAGDGTFAAGLVDAITQVISEKQNVFLVCYDVVAPEPLDAARHFDYSLGIALRLGAKCEPGNLGFIRLLQDNEDRDVTPCQNVSLEPLRRGNPIGAGLPLLEALAKKAAASIVIPYVMGRQLNVEVNQ